MDVFEHTHTIQIELSNICPHAWLHKKCPLNLEMISPFRHRNPTVLPSKVVYSILDTLGEHNYKGGLSFHVYNEGTIDPRYFEFVRYAKRVCPTCKVLCLTNGMYLSAQMAREMSEAGVDNLHMTLYGTKEDKAARREWFIREIMPQFPKDQSNTVGFGMDDRIADNYDGEYRDLYRICYAPLRDITISHKGDVVLCCQDWKRRHTFGNLCDKGLDEIIREGEMYAVYQRLQMHDRTVYDMCRRCKTSR